MPTLLRLAFSPDGHRLALTSIRYGVADRGVIEVWDLNTRVRKFQVEDEALFDRVRFSPDGSRLAAIVQPPARNGALRVWDAKSGTLQIGREGPSRIDQIAFSPDGTCLVASGFDGKAALGTLEVWRGVPGTKVLSLTFKGVQPTVALSPDGRSLAYSVGSEFARLLDTTTLQEVAAWKDSTPLAFSPDSGTLALVTRDNVRLIELGSRHERLLERRVTSGGWIGFGSTGAFSSDGRAIAQVLGPPQVGHQVTIWTVSAGKTKLALAREYTSDWFFSSDSALFIREGRKGYELYDLETGKKEVLSPAGRPPFALGAGAVSRNWVAVQSADGIRLWSLDKWRRNLPQ